MGSPEYYYKELLQNLAYHLYIDEDKDLAIKFLRGKSISALEHYVLKKKSGIKEKDFYYAAGKTVGNVIKRADDEDGIDGFNACIGGLSCFEDFIGVLNDND